MSLYNRARNKNLSKGSDGELAENLVRGCRKGSTWGSTESFAGGLAGSLAEGSVGSLNGSLASGLAADPACGLAGGCLEGLAKSPAASALFVSGSPVGVSASLLQELATQVEFVLAVDGGAEHLVAADLVPDLLIGDFDSISKSTLAYLEAKGVPTQSYDSYKNATDVELGVEELYQRGYKRLIATNVLGGRTDHALGSLGALAGAAHGRGMELVLRDEHETCFFLSAGATTRVLELDFENDPLLSGRLRWPRPATAPSYRNTKPLRDGLLNDKQSLLARPRPQHVSLIAWGGSVTVSLTGTEWELDHYELSPCSARGVSNLVRSAQLRLEVHEGCGTILLLLTYTQ